MGKFAAADALTIDSSTKKPINIRNDNGMEGIFVYGFDTDRGVQLYIDTVRNLTSTGLVDGFFGVRVWGMEGLCMVYGVLVVVLVRASAYVPL